MNVIAINGSPRKDGNTFTVLKAMTEELEKEQIRTEIIQVGDKLLHGCIACGYCRKSEGNFCVFKDDMVNEVAEKMRKADGFILGSPTYYGGIAGTMKSFLDRLFFTSGRYFRYKAAAVVAVTRRAGAVDTTNQLMNYLRLSQTITPPSQYWTIVYGADKGEVLQDEEGMQTARRNAQAMAWLLQSLKESEAHVPALENGPKAMTNFIR